MKAIKAIKLVASMLQILLIVGCTGAILSLASGIAYSALTEELAPWLEWLDAIGLRCINYW